MLEGAIIGGVVGGAVSALWLFKNARWHARFLSALDGEGADRARQVLDRAVAPHPGGAVSLNKLLLQRARLSGLALLGDVAALEAETARVDGGAAALAQVKAIGLVGLAVRAADPAPLRARMDELEQQVHQEANKLQKLIKDRASALAAVVRALNGEPLPEAWRKRLEGWFGGDDKLTRILLYRALQLALERNGQSGALYAHRLGEASRLF